MSFFILAVLWECMSSIVVVVLFSGGFSRIYFIRAQYVSMAIIFVQSTVRQCNNCNGVHSKNTDGNDSICIARYFA